MLENEEALRHALPPRDSVALGWRGTHHLEEVLGDSEMVLLLRVLAYDSVHDSLEDVFFGYDALHVLDQVVGFRGLVTLQVVDDQVEASFGDHVDERRQDLKSVLATAENNEDLELFRSVSASHTDLQEHLSYTVLWFTAKGRSER